jgi:hypothetical protein
MTDNYNELSMGYPANISGMTSASRGFTANRLMGYAESHDEERLMYKNLQYGNNTNPAREKFRCGFVKDVSYWSCFFIGSRTKNDLSFWRIMGHVYI